MDELVAMLPFMHTCCAYLGHQPKLSLAELAVTLADFKFLRMVGPSIALFETSTELNQKLLNTLGGTILFAQAVGEGSSVRSEDVPALFASCVATVKGKVTFSIRGHGMLPDRIRSLYRETKDALKRAGKPSRYIGTEHMPAASVLLHETEINDGKQGAELVILKEKDFFWVGQTKGVQNPNWYTKRDIGKPARDTRVGLLPPKLAQIMLNFGAWMVTSKGKKLKDITVLDPFCGSGVIPMEAMLRGWAVLCSDASQKAITATESNIEWLRKGWKILKKDVDSSIEKHDALKPFTFKTLPDMVVSETMLGENLTKMPTAREVTTLKNECDKLEIDFLKNAAATLPGVPLAIMWPVWLLKTGPVYLEKVAKTAHDLGYRIVMPAAVTPDTPRGTLIYKRPEQFVGREIVLLQPK